MKSFLAGIGVLIFLVVSVFFAFKYFVPSSPSPQQTSQLNRTLTGVLEKVPSTEEYNHVINANGEITNITSNTIDLAPYENKNVKVTGQYSGSTMYADKIEILQ